MHTLIIDGHPAPDRLNSVLLDYYETYQAPGTTTQRVAVRDLLFDPNLHGGYTADQPWEPDLERLGDALRTCDHLVVAFPLWWGSEPSLLKGLLDRMLLPGFAFRYHKDDQFWDRLLVGRSADVIVTMDTPPWYLRLVYGDPIGRRWRRQVLGFCGFGPIRIIRLGPTRRGGAAKHMTRWNYTLKLAAMTAVSLKRGDKLSSRATRSDFSEAISERQS